MHLQKGTLLKGGDYIIESVLGQGGFGITYLAVQIGLNRKVAVKEFFMKDHCERDPVTSCVKIPSTGSRELVDRFRVKFLKEARTIAEMDNPHVIRIHDVFEENGTAYYVMEYLRGGSLSDIIPAGGLPESEAVGYIRQIAEALRYIHEEKHVLHLDVKPSNVHFRSDGELVLIDFGISKHYDEADDGQTSTTPVGASRGYAPLEQYKVGGLSQFTPATDIYSLGATLYKLLTGNTPADANDVNEDGLMSLPEKVSAPVRAVIWKSMRPRRKDRPQSIEEFLAIFDETCLIVADEVKEKPTRRYAWLWPICISLVLVTIAFSTYLLRNHREKNPILQSIVPPQTKDTLNQKNAKNLHQGYEWVDLGLPSGLKWATCNVGASNSDECGCTFAWGEIEPIELGNKSCRLYEKYNLKDISGNPDYDAARSIWGGKWRMPMKNEVCELFECCSIKEYAKGNRIGLEVVGPNGNEIFLPATYWHTGDEVYYPGPKYYYWTSTPVYEERGELDSYSPYSDSESFYGPELRKFGCSIRPVFHD